VELVKLTAKASAWFAIRLDDTTESPLPQSALDTTSGAYLATSNGGNCNRLLCAVEFVNTPHPLDYATLSGRTVALPPTGPLRGALPLEM
jgi:hypothetical protein